MQNGGNDRGKLQCGAKECIYIEKWNVNRDRTSFDICYRNNLERWVNGEWTDKMSVCVW